MGFVYGREEAEEEEEEEGRGTKDERRKTKDERRKKRKRRKKKDREEDSSGTERDLNRHDIITNKPPPPQKMMISNNVVHLIIYIHTHIYIPQGNRCVVFSFLRFRFKTICFFLLLRREIVKGQRSERLGFKITDAQWIPRVFHVCFFDQAGHFWTNCPSAPCLPSFGTVIGWF